MTANRSDPAPLRVLVADDFPDAADSVCMMLRLWGHDGDTAYCGATALSLFEKRAHDVVIADLAMPDVSGFELAQQIRCRPGPRPLLIAITGLVSLGDRQRASENGFDHYLLKPCDPEQLRRLLEAAKSCR